MTNFKKRLQESAKAVTDALDKELESDDRPEAKILDAMRYASLAGGKRIRPFLVLATANLFNVSEASALRVAAAVEMVHTYSLIHDDLPAMDDDELRRGMPTCHIHFDEATAILAGDALLTKAFEILSSEMTYSDPKIRCELIFELSKAIGADGMVGGQMLDLIAENQTLEMPEVARLQRLKTGLLISYSCEAGAILGRAPESLRHALHAYAHDIGLAFQIVDDLLDVEGNEEEVGKKTGKDAAAGKATFVSLMGQKRARAQALMLSEQAVRHLNVFADKATPLRELAQFVVERTA